MPHYQDLTHAVTSLPFSERMHVLEALDASFKADHADSGSFSAEQSLLMAAIVREKFCSSQDE